MYEMKNIKNYGQALLESQGGDTEMNFAAKRGQTKRLKELIQRGEDPNLKGSHGHTPLYAALSSYIYMDTERRKTVVRILLEAGADPNIGRTLSAAIFQDPDPELISMLLDAGADVNTKDKGGRTALHDACVSSWAGPEILEILIKRGANLEERDHLGQLPLMFCGGFSPLDPSKVEALARAGADLNAKDSYGHPFIFNVGYHRDPNSLETLKSALQNGADPNIKYKENSVLSRFLRQPEINKDVIKELLKAGADPFKDAFVDIKHLVEYFGGDVSWWKNPPQEIKRIQKVKNVFGK